MSRAEIAGDTNNSSCTTQNVNRRDNSSSNSNRGRKRRLSASCIFLMVTIVITATASGLIVLALMTDHWVYIDFDRTRVTQTAANDTRVQWLMSGRVAILSSPAAVTTATATAAATGSPVATDQLTQKPSSTLNRPKRAVRTAYLVPKYSGVWAICTNLNNDEREQLAHMGYDHAWCEQFLSADFLTEGPNDWMTRMQNLSISCSIVGLILLGTAALVGLFGVLKRQISAVLVTGVMYILAATFCVFTLSIMEFKRKASKECGQSDPTVPIEYGHALLTTTGWSLTIGWIGVPFCVLAAFLWYLLSKILRYGPITLTQHRCN